MINQERAAEHIPLTAALHADEAGVILAAFSRLILRYGRCVERATLRDAVRVVSKRDFEAALKALQSAAASRWREIHQRSSFR